jgi:hypothetical protein
LFIPVKDDTIERWDIRFSFCQSLDKRYEKYWNTTERQRGESRGGLHIDRTVGGHRHHRHPGRHAPALPEHGQAVGPTDGLSEPTQATGLRQHPVRSGSLRWPQMLYPYYKNVTLLVCPTDSMFKPQTGGDANTNNLADNSPRTYMINGYNDYFLSNLDNATFNNSFMAGTYPQGLRDDRVQYPSDTIMFGEKKPVSPQYYMDLLEQGADNLGNDWTELNQSTHTVGSDYCFADNSARLLKTMWDMGPLNQWGVTSWGRTEYAVDISTN